MRYLYAIYNPNLQDHLIFFGEDHTKSVKTRRGRRPKTIQTLSHPSAMEYEDLLFLLSGHCPENSIKPCSITLLLPAIGTIPLSPDNPLPDADISFIPFQYPGIAYPLDKISNLLPSLGQNTHDGIIITDSIVFFQKTFEFALEFTSRECFLPEVAENKGPTGRWTGFYDSKDQERILTLAEAMPGICFAFTEQTENPGTLLIKFINDSINTIVKTALKNSVLPHKPRAKTLKNPASQWLLSLWGGEIDEDSQFFTDVKTIKEVTGWVAEPAKNTQVRPFYTCLRLVEPSEGSSEFQIRFMIQASDDPSLLIPAEEIWKKKSASFTYLNRRFDRPSEQLLADLFHAGNIFAPIQVALRTKAPSGMTLTNDQVYPFLSEAVPILRQRNIQALLPSWWKDSSKRPVLRVLVSQKQKKKTRKGHGFFTPGALLSYTWEISVGDTIISADEFFKLVKLKMPLVYIGGKWAAFSTDDIKKAIDTFKRAYPDDTMESIDALRLGLAGHEDLRISVEVKGTDKETNELFSSFIREKSSSKMASIKVPETFRGELRPYQQKGLSWLSFITGIGLGACLADDMGLGKTVQLIAYILACRKEGISGTSLLICPMSLIGNWQREISRFGPGLTYYVHHGPVRETGTDFSRMVMQHDIVLTSYQMAYRDQVLFESEKWDLIVLDEAQNIKNSETRQSKAVRALKSGRKIALTGTPVENRLTELWSIMEFLNPGYLGAENRFERKYSSLIEKYHNKEAAEQLSRLVKPFILRRVKTDRSIIADLPEKNVMRRYCTLTTEQATLYQAMVDSILSEVDDAEGITRRAKILTALLRLKQICNHPDAFLDDGNLIPDRSGKISLLFSLLEEVLAIGEAAILFTQFSSFGERLVDLMKSTFKEEVLFLHGKTPRKVRDEMVQQFSHPHGPKLFVLSLKAGGVGLNLTRANHVFHVDRWWNPAVEDQATDRAYRIGQEKNVSVHLLISAGTVEERIDMLIEEKRTLAGSIIGTGEDWITSLSTNELRDLLSLRGELIGGEA